MKTLSQGLIASKGVSFLHRPTNKLYNNTVMPFVVIDNVLGS